MRSCLSVCLCANQDGYITNAIHVETCNPARGIRIYAPDNSTGHSPWTLPSEKEPPPLEKYPPKIPHPNIRTFPKNIPGHFPREKQILSRSQLSVSTNGRHCLFIIYFTSCVRTKLSSRQLLLARQILADFIVRAGASSR